MILSKLDEQKGIYDQTKFYCCFKKLIDELQIENEKEKFHVEKLEELQIEKEIPEEKVESKILTREDNYNSESKQKFFPVRRREKGLMSRHNLQIGTKINENLLAEKDDDTQEDENLEQYYEIRVYATS
jgi:hypothetical protein